MTVGFVLVHRREGDPDFVQVEIVSTLDPAAARSAAERAASKLVEKGGGFAYVAEVVSKVTAVSRVDSWRSE